MPDAIIDGRGSGNVWKIDEDNAGLIVGSVAITNTDLEVVINVSDYISVTPSGTFYSTIEASGGFLPISGQITVTSENVPYDSLEQVTDILGSPSAATHVFTGGVTKTLIVKPQYSAYINFDSTADTDSFVVGGGESLSADFEVGSVSSLAKGRVGSIWIWGGR